MPFDHSLVDFLERTYRHSAAWAWIDVWFRPDIVLVLTVLVGAAAWVMRRRGRAVPSWLDDIRGASVVAIVALIVAVALKVTFGRSWIPLYISQGLDDFRWFAGEWTRQRGAFPSATACASTAPAAALWRRSSALRVPAVAIAALFSVIVVVQEYHWLSDVVIGVVLGVGIAYAMPTRRSPALNPPDPLQNPSRPRP